MRKQQVLAIALSVALGLGPTALRPGHLHPPLSPVADHRGPVPSRGRAGAAVADVASLFVRPRPSRAPAVSRSVPSPAPAPPPRAAPAPAPDPWAALRECESGDRYGADTGNGYYGAYQFTAGTWASLGFSGLPSQAPPALQDRAAQELEARRGWSQWPACAEALGLT